jgi:hypothetical protein
MLASFFPGVGISVRVRGFWETSMQEPVPLYALLCAFGVGLGYIALLVGVALTPDLFALDLPIGLSLGSLMVLTIHIVPVGLAFVYLRQARRKR